MSGQFVAPASSPTGCARARSPVFELYSKAPAGPGLLAAREERKTPTQASRPGQRATRQGLRGISFQTTKCKLPAVAKFLRKIAAAAEQLPAVGRRPGVRHS